jgi:hypothetical protein
MSQLPNDLIMNIIKQSTELKRQKFAPVLDQIKSRTGIMGEDFGLLQDCYMCFWTLDHPENFEEGFKWNHDIEYNNYTNDHPESLLTLWGSYC